MWYIKAEINYSTHPALTAAALGMALHWGMPGPECTQALPSGSPWPCTGGCRGPSAPRPCPPGVHGPALGDAGARVHPDPALRESMALHWGMRGPECTQTLHSGSSPSCGEETQVDTDLLVL